MGNYFTQLNYKVIERKIEKCKQQGKAKKYFGKKWRCKVEEEKLEKSKKIQ